MSTPATECRRCGGRSADAFLCRSCARILRQVLADLPWWLNRLTEAAVGQTRMSDNAGRRSARRRDLDGETPLAACIEQLPDDEDLDRARRERQKSALAHALSAGGINARASALLFEVNDSLGYWTRVLCEQRGITAPQLGAGRTMGGLRARWLHANLSAIVASEDAADICGDIEGHQDDIVATVNRKERSQFLGECPTWLEDDRRVCGRRLRALPDALEVHCRACKSTHNVARLQLDAIQTARRETLTWDELLGVNRRLPDGYRVPERTLRHWKLRGRITPAAWIRAETGRVVPSQHADADTALYRWGDVEVLRVERERVTRA